jgi:REP element-mobilizing transposase RayT
MSARSYSRCWIHLISGTLNREKMPNKGAAAQVSRYLGDYAKTKGVYMKINYVNADHVHSLIDLPTNLSIEDLVQLFKGSFAHWINANNVITGKFALGKRLWRIFCIRIKCGSGRGVHRRSGSPSSFAAIRR